MSNINIQNDNSVSLTPPKGGWGVLTKYFSLTDRQKQQFEALDALYHDWNSKINVISRKDIDNLYEHHVLHSLAIAELIRFKPGTSIMDLGTGGGFPGIPLAIMFPEAKFHLVDSTKKKILVCEEVSKALELKNVTTQWCRAEEVKQQFHFVVSRAVMPLPDLVKIIRGRICREQINGLPNGLICLKGGELEQEAKPFAKTAQITSLSEYFKEEFFETKKLVYLPI